MVSGRRRFQCPWVEGRFTLLFLRSSVLLLWVVVCDQAVRKITVGLATQWDCRSAEGGDSGSSVRDGPRGTIIQWESIAGRLSEKARKSCRAVVMKRLGDRGVPFDRCKWDILKIGVLAQSDK